MTLSHSESHLLENIRTKYLANLKIPGVEIQILSFSDLCKDLKINFREGLTLLFYSMDNSNNYLEVYLGSVILREKVMKRVHTESEGQMVQ